MFFTYLQSQLGISPVQHGCYHSTVVDLHTKLVAHGSEYSLPSQLAVHSSLNNQKSDGVDSAETLS